MRIFSLRIQSSYIRECLVLGYNINIQYILEDVEKGCTLLSEELTLG